MALEVDKCEWMVDQLVKELNINEVAFNFIFQHLFDNVTHQVDGVDTPLSL